MVQGIIIIVSVFVLGAIFGWSLCLYLNPVVGLLNVDDESDPNKTKWIFQLDPKISPDEISKKAYVRFMVYHNWR